MLSVSLPQNKFLEWSEAIKHMLQKGQVQAKNQESTIGLLTHLALVIPGIHHFLGCLPDLLWTVQLHKHIPRGPLSHEKFPRTSLIGTNYERHCIPMPQQSLLLWFLPVQAWWVQYHGSRLVHGIICWAQVSGFQQLHPTNCSHRLSVDWWYQWLPTHWRLFSFDDQQLHIQRVGSQNQLFWIGGQPN